MTELANLDGFQAAVVGAVALAVVLREISALGADPVAVASETARAAARAARAKASLALQQKAKRAPGDGNTGRDRDRLSLSMSSSNGDGVDNKSRVIRQELRGVDSGEEVASDNGARALRLLLSSPLGIAAAEFEVSLGRVAMLLCAPVILVPYVAPYFAS